MYKYIRSMTCRNPATLTPRACARGVMNQPPEALWIDRGSFSIFPKDTLSLWKWGTYVVSCMPFAVVMIASFADVKLCSSDKFGVEMSSCGGVCVITSLVVLLCTVGIWITVKKRRCDAVYAVSCAMILKSSRLKLDKIF